MGEVGDWATVEGEVYLLVLVLQEEVLLVVVLELLLVEVDLSLVMK